LPTANGAAVGKDFFVFLSRRFLKILSTKISLFLFFLHKNVFADGRPLAKLWSLCRRPPQPSAKLGVSGKISQLCRRFAVGKAGKIFFFFFCFLHSQHDVFTYI
jgi:hypothetical protein